MCCAWCCTWSSWAWTTRFKTTRRMRLDMCVWFTAALHFTVQTYSIVSTRVLPDLMLPGALYWGALPRQLVPWHQPPLQSAPCHQLCKGSGSWDGSWSEERGSAKHQHWSFFLWPGKKNSTAISDNPTIPVITVWCHSNKNNWKWNLLWLYWLLVCFCFCTSCQYKTVEGVKVGLKHSMSHRAF